MDPFNPELIKTLSVRELNKNPQAIERPKGFDLGMEPTHKSSTISPELLQTLGGMADITGTVTGMHKLHSGEDNSMLNHGGTLGVGLGLAGQLGATKLATYLLRKKSPHLADAIAANLGARQLSLGSDWATRMDGSGNPYTGNEVVDRKLIGNLQHTQSRGF